MITRFVKWLFAPSQKPIICDDIDGEALSTLIVNSLK